MALVLLSLARASPGLASTIVEAEVWCLARLLGAEQLWVLVIAAVCLWVLDATGLPALCRHTGRLQLPCSRALRLLLFLVPVTCSF